MANKHRQPLDTWHFMNGKVILLGDYAHSMVPHLGAGAGQAMEDGWILGRALSDYVKGKESPAPRLSSLEEVASLYQSARLPRAQKAQAASRMVCKTYGCQTDNLIDLTFDQCCPVIEGSIAAALKWVGTRIWIPATINQRTKLCGSQTELEERLSGV